MTEREKVILGLRCHKAGVYEECLKCPYHDDGCETTLCNDAIALLKEQEARVMAREEARETLHTSEFLYCEDKNDDTRAGGLLRGVLNGEGYWDLINGEYMTPDCLDEGEDLEAEYGKTFRFWTSRPTPEQMRDAKWEDSDAE